ncbi:MAG: metalloregulator ArsR/SmtB family transcription factor [bacterium]|nr:metalloregulator ArsR/SmtB family transcription factor [bacterium]
MKDRDLERVLKAFANRRRVAIVRLVRKSREASVGDIADDIRLSFRATSKHLATLSAVDILEKEQRGLQVFYRVAHDIPDVAQKILSLL